MTDRYAALAEIWFEHAEGHRFAEQKRRCSTLSWYYLMLDTMEGLQP
jgi:hypothetical protein